MKFVALTYYASRGVNRLVYERPDGSTFAVERPSPWALTPAQHARAKP